jgi:hypothetical protein
MARFAAMLILLLVLPISSCGSFFVGFVSNPGGNMTISGSVTGVSVAVFQSMGTSVPFTAVTFASSGTAVTINFCGNQGSLFPINQFVRANFTTGVSCSTLIAVSVSA